MEATLRQVDARTVEVSEATIDIVSAHVILRCVRAENQKKNNKNATEHEGEIIMPSGLDEFKFKLNSRESVVEIPFPLVALQNLLHADGEWPLA